VAVQHPGRQNRLSDPCPADMAALADEIAEALRVSTDGELALFGHSMGACVAYEVTRRLERSGGMPVSRLFLSGCAAPDVPPGPPTPPRSDDELIAEVVAVESSDRRMLDDPDIRELMLPALRADYRIIDGYRPDQIDPVRAPIHAMHGRQDTTCTEADVNRWARWTTGGFSLRVFDGGHFYLTPGQEVTVAHLVAQLG
jgi:pyochelin biosynthetic protein PchC